MVLGECEIRLFVAVAKPARRWIAAGEITEERIFCVSVTVEAEAAIRRAALHRIGDFDENTTSES